MTQDETIEMAKQVCDIDTDKRGRNTFLFDEYGLEAFAKLVAQHAKAEEREACAKIAEIPDGEYEVVVSCGTEPTLRRIPKYLNWQDIVKAIRARGQE